MKRPHLTRHPVLIAFAVIAVLPFGAPSQESVLEGAEIEVQAPARPKLSELQTKVEAVRTLRFKRAPVYKVLKQAEIVPLLRKEIDEQYGKGAGDGVGAQDGVRAGDGVRQLEHLFEAYERLGLFESTEGLVDRLLEAYAAQLAAFYDHETDTVHLIEDLNVPPVMQTLAEVHELLHALQDQHFDLASLPIEDVHHTDQATAALALVEGDAMLAMLEYQTDYATITTGDALRMAFAAMQPAPSTPYLFQREMTFAYFDGLRFVQALHNAGGWKAVDKAFADPPASTEQVLHYRDKYLRERDEPTDVELPDCTAALGEGWRLVAEDTIGELYTQVLFRQNLSFLRAGKPSRGWDGDRLHMYRSGEGAEDSESDDVLVWRTVWDSEQDADEFAKAYGKLLARKLRRTRRETVQMTRDDDDAELVASGTRGVGLVRTDGAGVLVVEAASAATARRVARYILAQDEAQPLTDTTE